MEQLLPIPGVTFIGFGHKARNGKDTAARAIHNAYPSITRCVAYADALRVLCRVQYGMTKKDGPLLQRVGTDIVRAQDPTLWVRTLYWTVDENPAQYVLVTDCRFPNEVDFIHQMGGPVVKVIRRNKDGSQFIDPSRSATHPSECALDAYADWDYTIDSFAAADTERLALDLFGQIRHWNEDMGTLNEAMRTRNRSFAQCAK